MPDYVASAPGGGPPVLLLHTWWGLNQVIKDLADRLAADGFTVEAHDEECAVRRFKPVECRREAARRVETRFEPLR